MKAKPVRLICAAAFACAGASHPAFAQGTFNPGVGTSVNCDAGASGTTLTTKSCTAGSVTATMTAWGFTNATLSSTPQSGFTQGKLADWNSSGFGAYTGTKEASPQHAFDNMTSGCGTSNVSAASGTSTNNFGCGGSIEALLLNFNGSKVNLTNVGIGYKSGDADLMVWAWTGGSGGPAMATQQAKGSTTATGATSTVAASLTGWQLVSALDMATNTDGTVPQTATGGTLFSSYFLITTYFGAATGNLNAGNDAFKINSFTVANCAGTLTGGDGGNGATCTPQQQASPAPEPGTLSLAAMALLALVRAGSSARSRSWRAA